MRSILRKAVHLVIIKTGKITSLRKNYRKKLLIIRTDAVGDFILFSPSIEYLKNYYKDYKIEILVRDYLKLLAEQCPYFSKVLTFNRNKFRINLIYKLIIFFQIYKEKYEICIDPIYSNDWFSDEIIAWSGSKNRIGWDLNYPDRKIGKKVHNRLIKNNFSIKTHETERNKFFIQQLGMRVNDYKPNIWIENSTELVKKLWIDNNLDKKFVVAIFPGKMTAYNRWESEKFLKVIKFLNEKIDNVFFLISGTNKDEKIINSDALKNYSALNICGKTNLIELYDLIKNVNLIIGYDSGPIHMAIMTGTNSICVLGGGHFGRFLPYGDPIKHKYVYVTMPCYNCDWNCIYDSAKCIDDIPEEVVITEIFDLLPNIKI